jgi:hypothetical protein
MLLCFYDAFLFFFAFVVVLCCFGFMMPIVDQTYDFVFVNLMRLFVLN